MRIEESYTIFSNLRIKMINMLQVMDNPYSIEDRIKHALDGSIKFADCFVIQKLLAKKKPLTCLEIGSFLGFSTRWLLECSRDWDMHVTALDPNMRHRIFDNPRWMVEGLNATHYPDRLEIQTGFFGAHGLGSSDYEVFEPQRSKEWVAKFLSSRQEFDTTWERTFDCIYIDADHSYESVMDGFNHAVNLLNPGGIIIFHDALTWKGVNQAMHDIKIQFSDKANVEIIDGSNIFSHPLLLNEHSKVADGIGYFELLNS
ncbi:MAG: hypothetical protein EOM12_11465 [Verrucomicrobiae bacterium]|nr:hypothetical protein [Verrucomicrobiae bacterium]